MKCLVLAEKQLFMSRCIKAMIVPLKLPFPLSLWYIFIHIKCPHPSKSMKKKNQENISTPENKMAGQEVWRKETSMTSMWGGHGEMTHIDRRQNTSIKRYVTLSGSKDDAPLEDIWIKTLRQLLGVWECSYHLLTSLNCPANTVYGNQILGRNSC